MKALACFVSFSIAVLFLVFGGVNGTGTSSARASLRNSQNLSGAVSTASSSLIVIHGDRSVGALRIPSGKLTTAYRVFGRIHSIRRLGRGGINLDIYVCKVRWPIGISIEFSSPRDPSCRNGLADYATATGRRFRTDRGLRIGSTVATLRRLYPHAATQRSDSGSGYALFFRSCEEGGPGVPQTTLFALVHNGRVASLSISPPACE